MLGALLGLIPAILPDIIFFLISPILGVIWTVWLICLTVYAIKFKK